MRLSSEGRRARGAVALLVGLAAMAGWRPAAARKPDVSLWAVNVSGSEPATDSAVTDLHPRILIDGSVVHALWRNMSPQSVYSLSYARSLDGGKTFEPWKLIDADIYSDDEYGSAFAVQGSTMHIAALRRTSKEVVYYRSDDGGMTFGLPKTVATNASSMRMAVSGTTVSIALFSAGIYVASSSDNGASFQTVAVPTSGEPVATPIADFARDGDNLYLLYLADDNAPYVSHTWLYFVASEDGGATFPTKHLLTQPASDGLYYSSWSMDDRYARGGTEPRRGWCQRAWSHLTTRTTASARLHSWAMARSQARTRAPKVGWTRAKRTPARVRANSRGWRTTRVGAGALAGKRETARRRHGVGR